MSDTGINEARKIAEESEYGARKLRPGLETNLVNLIAFSWVIFQLLLPVVLLLDSTVVRAVHLGFSLLLVFLTHPFSRRRFRNPLFSALSARERIPVIDYVLAIVAALSAVYVAFELLMAEWNPGYPSIVTRQGRPVFRDVLIGMTLLVLLLEAARRSLGMALSVVAGAFVLYSFNAQIMPAGLDFRNVTISKFISKITMSTEGIYGIPLDVSANIVFLFVLFGSMLEEAGAGKYFVDLSFSLMGRFRGGPAKAAVLASGLTGMVSGSSIANTVTTGTFTIPLMKKMGYPAHKAAAVEVAVSTNGQLMPPIMGAAAFIVAETINIPYTEVIRAAFVPAVISYLALLYIVHLEALKLGIHGMKITPRFWSTLKSGSHFLIPLVFLVLSLALWRTSPALAAYRAIVVMAVVILLQNLWVSHRSSGGLKAGWKEALGKTGRQICASFVKGGKNMMGIGVAVAAAGIIVGVVTFGLSGIITEAIEILSGGRFLLILVITAVACLLLGMGLPTTATYIVMASLTAPVIVTLGAKNGVVFPLIAAHLFVFFFGILADDTPPVGLAAYAAAAIAKTNPVKTGIQGFNYDIRTAILPFIFMFNTDLLLYQVSSFWYAAWVFIMAMLAMFSFASITQGYMHGPMAFWEYPVLALVTIILLIPSIIAERFLPYLAEVLPGHGIVVLLGLFASILYGLMYFLNTRRLKKSLNAG